MDRAGTVPSEVPGSYEERGGGKIKPEFGATGRRALIVGDPAMQRPRSRAYLGSACGEQLLRSGHIQERANGVKALLVRPLPLSRPARKPMGRIGIFSHSENSWASGSVLFEE